MVGPERFIEFMKAGAAVKHRTPTPERLTGAELERQLAELHPSIRANFVYLPDTHTATHEEIRAAFPIPEARIQNFYRMVRDAQRAQANGTSEVVENVGNRD